MILFFFGLEVELSSADYFLASSRLQCEPNLHCERRDFEKRCEICLLSPHRVTRSKDGNGLPNLTPALPPHPDPSTIPTEHHIPRNALPARRILHDDLLARSPRLLMRYVLPPSSSLSRADGEGRAVARIRKPNGRLIYQVTGSNGVYTLFPESGEEGRGYCPCPAFATMVLADDSAIIVRFLPFLLRFSFSLLRSPFLSLLAVRSRVADAMKDSVNIS